MNRVITEEQFRLIRSVLEDGSEQIPQELEERLIEALETLACLPPLKSADPEAMQRAWEEFRDKYEWSCVPLCDEESSAEYGFHAGYEAALLPSPPTTEQSTEVQ